MSMLAEDFWVDIIDTVPENLSRLSVHVMAHAGKEGCHSPPGKEQEHEG
jgi:hypothetical protein